jgi:DNA polymerase I-like protein with 3'-5' exonuclease and polymerase domains
MKPELIVIDTNEGVIELITYLNTVDNFVALDTETTGVTKSSEVIGYSICAEETKAYYVILAKWNKDTGKLEYLETKNTVLDVMSILKTKDLIGHNFIFDAWMIENNFKIRLIENLHTDTMILAHLLDENRRVGLKELASSLFGEDSTKEAKEMKDSVLANGGQLTKSCYEMYKADSYLMGKYGAKDALLTYKLFLALIPDLYEQELDQFFYVEESMPLLKGPTYELNTTGIQIDGKALSVLKKTLEAECLEAKDFIHQEIKKHVQTKYPGTNKKNGFNIGSSQQLSWLLFGVLGLEFSTLTKGGKTVCKDIGERLPYTLSAKRAFISECERRKDEVYQAEYTRNGKKVKAKKLKDPWCYIACDKKTLAKLSHKYRWIERLLEYQKKIKMLKTYVIGLEPHIHYGIIHPSYLQHGTKTGRYSSKIPNMQNLPRNDKRVKACFVARPGKVFVGADYSQLEPRVFSYYSKDPRLMAAFDGSSDFYSVVGMEVFEKFDCTPQKDGDKNAFGVKYKDLRDLSKVIALASAYGSTANQLAPTTGKSVEDTEQDIDKYFEQFPGVLKMMLEAHELVKKQGFVKNLFGRPRRIPDAKNITKIYGKLPHSELPYEARKMLNMACNARIQGTGGSLINRASIKYVSNRDKLEIIAPIICQVHDFLAVECSIEDKETVALLLQDAMENTNKLEGIDLEAIPKIGMNLAEI